MCASRASQCGRLDAQKWHAYFHPGPDQMSGVEGLRVRVLGGFDAPSCPPDVWNRLLARGNTDVVCLTWEYQRSWWETFGYGKLLLLAAERDGEVVAIAPFFVDQGEVSFVGTGAADYLDFVGCVDEPDVLEGLLTAGQERVRGFLGACLYCVPAWSTTTERLRTAAARLGWECYEKARCRHRSST